MLTATTSTPKRRPGKREVRAKRKEIKQRYARKRKEGEGVPSMVQRFSELVRLYAERYRGFVFPDDDAGREDLKILAHTARPAGKPDIAWTCWAPWATDEYLDAMAKEVAAKPVKWKAATLGRVLSLTMDERTRHNIRTIAPFDCPLSKREAMAKEADRIRKAEERRAAGATPRELSAARLKPWLETGESRSTYYARKAREKLAKSAATPTQSPDWTNSSDIYLETAVSDEIVQFPGEEGTPKRAPSLAMEVAFLPSHSPRDDAARIGTVSKVRSHSEVNAKALGLVTTGDTHIKHLAWVFSKDQGQQFSAQPS